MSETEDRNAQDRHGAHEVAAWLRRHPGFLKQFPDLALSLVVPRDDGRTASLASYQLEVLRDKNRELSRRLAELSANALDNERLAVRTHQLTLSLMRQDSYADSLRAMAASLSEDFNGDLVRIVSFRPVAGMEDADWLQVRGEGEPEMQPFRDALREGEPLCGRLQPEKLDYLFGTQKDEVQSSVLMPVGNVGMLAIGSGDMHRFHPGMGTVFLKLIAETIAAAIVRYS